nr:pyruvate kinase [Sodalis-like endosymbiont of Proechinophthirus fluctus]
MQQVHYPYPSQLIEINVMKKSKIVCTIGPKTKYEEVLSSLLKMNVIRLKFFYGNYEEARARAEHQKSAHGSEENGLGLIGCHPA